MSARAAAWILFLAGLIAIAFGWLLAALFLVAGAGVAEACHYMFRPSPDQRAARRRARPAPVFQARPNGARR